MRRREKMLKGRRRKKKAMPRDKRERKTGEMLRRSGRQINSL